MLWKDCAPAVGEQGDRSHRTTAELPLRSDRRLEEAMDAVLVHASLQDDV